MIVNPAEISVRETAEELNRYKDQIEVDQEKLELQRQRFADYKD